VIKQYQRKTLLLMEISLTGNLFTLSFD